MPEPSRTRKWLYIMTIIFSVVTLVVAAVGLGYGIVTGTEQFWSWIMGYVAAAAYLYWLKLDREVGPWFDKLLRGKDDGSE